MRRRLERIEQRLQRIRQRMGKDRTQQDIERFFVTGQLPESEPARSFALLTQAFDRVVDASIGGGENYDSAVDAYQRALEQYNNAVCGVSL
ncbi:MAG TPA: hypothetical protein PLL20_22180 [Phycisphaerae bacterium]|nr:hypothetical protein [Phycisphaerae bacterium]HRS12982.1 hypothetical protein [Sedimentisphaerales bacterium]